MHLMANATARKRHSLAVFHPSELKNAQAKKIYKQKLLRENPETLRADFSQTGAELSITNLLLYSENTEAWHWTICTHCTHHNKRGICSSREIAIKDKDSDSAFLNVNVYHNGTISIASLGSVHEDFNTLKFAQNSIQIPFLIS